MKKYLLYVLIILLSLLPISAVVAETALVLDTTTTYSGWATSYTWQNKNFYASGRLWVFYSDGNIMAYKTSTDGVNWTAKTSWRNTPHSGFSFTVHYDGEFLHYSFNGAMYGEDLLYRKGRPNADGTITWLGAEQIVYDVPPTSNSMYCQIITDSNGYPWICYLVKPSNWPTTPAIGYVVKSSVKDGTWITASGFPYNLTGNHVSNFGIPHMTNLPNGKIYFVWNNDTASLPNSGVMYNSTWGTVEQATHLNSGGNGGMVISDGEHVYYTYTTSGYHIRERTESGWGTALLVPEATASTAMISLTLIGTDNILLTWADTSNSYIKYCELKNGALSTPVNWISEPEGFPSIINNNALAKSNSLCTTAVTYITRTNSPYNVKFALLNLGNPPPLPPPPEPTNTTSYILQSAGYDVYSYNKITGTKTLIKHVNTLEEAYQLIYSLP